VNVVVGVFLSPFIVHRLGDAAFGVWVLIFSITGYYGLFDLGIRSSIVRYVSKYTATNETDKLARYINTSLFTYTGTGMLAMAVTVVLTVLVNSLFHVPRELQAQARWLMLMAGGSVALGFPLGVFGGILDGLQRFYFTNWTSIATTLLRAVLIVYVLHRGYGILTVALITVALPILGAMLRGVIVFRLLRIPIGLKYVDRESFKQMAHYSGTTLIIIIAARLRFRTDELVLGSMISTIAVTFFTVGARLVDYAQELVASLAQIFVPMSSQSEAVGNLDLVRKIYVAGNRACAFTIFPLAASLLILGKSVIEVWMGRKYVAVSYPVTVILIIPVTLLFMQAASGRILMGLGRHRSFALVTLMEGIANLIFSIVLVRPYGIVGDALGTAIPMFLTTLFFLPRHMSKQLGVPVLSFIRQAYTLPLLLVAPMAATLWLMQRWSYAHNWRQLLIQIAAGGSVYGVGLIWVYKTKRAFHVAELVSAPKSAVAEQPEPVVSV
jgi:O-antigen/teichoic acid export membrane protein